MREITLEEWDEMNIAELVTIMQGKGITHLWIDATKYDPVVKVKDEPLES